MKLITFFSFAILSQFTRQALAAEKLYFVEPMICRGLIQGNHSQVHPSYNQIGLRLNSFKSTRRDGSLADSLNWKTNYAASGEPLDLTFAHYGESWQMGPLRVNEAGLVYRKNVSGRGDDLTLKVTSSEIQGTKRVDTLVGTLNLPETVAGSYSYKLSCTAVVVKAPHGVMNLTAPR